MKKDLMITALMVAVFSMCAVSSFGQTAKKKNVVKKVATVKSAVSAADISEGKAMLSKSDCLACHTLDAKLVGPAYAAVAKKYPATEASYELLSKKIINGGSGTWGEVPMSPHPSVTVTDAKKMVKYILSLK